MCRYLVSLMHFIHRITTATTSCHMQQTIIGQPLALSGDDSFVVETLPFPHSYFSQSYTTSYTSTNGLVTYGSGTSAYSNDLSLITNAIAVFWDDLYTNQQTIYVATLNSAPNRIYITQWTNMDFYGSSLPLGTFQLWRYENSSRLGFYYVSLAGNNIGDSASIGIVDPTGTVLRYSENQAILSSGDAIEFVATNTNYVSQPWNNPPSILLISSAIPNELQIITPVDGSSFLLGEVTLSWSAQNSPTFYKIYIASDPTYVNTVYTNTNYLSTTYSFSCSANSYTWKVYACNANGCIESCSYEFSCVNSLSPPPPSVPLSPPPLLPPPPSVPLSPPPLLPPPPSSPPLSPPPLLPPPPSSPPLSPPPLLPPPPSVPLSPPPLLPPPPSVPLSPPPLLPPPPSVPLRPPPLLPPPPSVPPVPLSPPPLLPPPPSVPLSPPPLSPPSVPLSPPPLSPPSVPLSPPPLSPPPPSVPLSPPPLLPPPPPVPLSPPPLSPPPPSVPSVPLSPPPLLPPPPSVPLSPPPLLPPPPSVPLSPPPLSPPPPPGPLSPPPLLPPPPSVPLSPPPIFAWSTDATEKVVSSVVGSTVATSMSVSIATSTSAGTANIVQMIGDVQMMNIQQDLAGAGPQYQSFTKSIDWINANVHSDTALHNRRRYLLSSSANDPTQMHFTKLFLFTVILVPIFLLHGIISHYKRLELPGIFGFPQFQLTIANLACIPLVDSATQLILYRSQKSLIIGILTILLIPIPIIGYECYFIYKHIVQQRSLCYSGNTNTDDPWVITERQNSHWIRAHQMLYHRRAGIPQNITPVFQINPETGSYIRYKITPVVLTLRNRIQSYIVPLTLLKKIVITVLLRMLRSSPLLQTSLCLSVVATFAFLHISMPMYSSFLYHIPDTLIALTESVLYLLSLIGATSRKHNSRIDHGMVICQIIILFILIISKVGILIWTIRKNKKKTTIIKRFPMKRDFVRKYANRWLWVVHGRTLQGWPRPPIPTRAIHLCLQNQPNDDAKYHLKNDIENEANIYPPLPVSSQPHP